MAGRQRIRYCGAYNFAGVEGAHSVQSEPIIATDMDVDLISSDVRDVFDLCPENHYSFTLALNGEKLTRKEQFLNKIVTDSSSKKNSLSLDVTIIPTNFIALRVVVTHRPEFPDQVSSIYECDPEALQSIFVVAVNPQEDDLDSIGRRVLNAFARVGQEVNLTESSLELYDESGYQYCESLVFRHSDLVVLKVDDPDSQLQPSANHQKYPTVAQTSFKANTQQQTIAKVTSQPLVDAPVVPDVRPPLPPVFRQCLICLEDVPMEQMYIINCTQNHAFCVECLQGHVSTSITPTDESVGFVPSCPCANQANGCKYTMSEQEISQILNLAQRQGSLERSELKTLKRRAQKLYFRTSCLMAGQICCPNCPSDENNDGVWFEVPPHKKREGAAVECPCCELSFCCKCKAMPYHYNCKCEEVMSHARFWMEWNMTGRDRYAQKMSERDSAYRAALNMARAQHEDRVRAAEIRFRTARENEEAMSRMYKMCPSCSTPIEHWSGCDLMVCGRDYHGNSLGLGCGHGFRFSQAPAYRARDGTEPVQADVGQLEEPERVMEIQHMICDDTPHRCDCCNGPIVGPMIQCINCPALSLCFQCSSTVDFGDDPSGHNNNHICTVLFE